MPALLAVAQGISGTVGVDPAVVNTLRDPDVGDVLATLNDIAPTLPAGGVRTP